MDVNLERLLRELEVSGRDNDAREPERQRKMLNLERETARFMHLLVLSSGRKRIVEIGTSHGYSTIWLADALGQVAASQPLISIEREADKVSYARANLRRAAVEDRVELHQGDATSIVATLTGSFDCVFFDADRVSAPVQLRLLLPKLERNVLLLADNALSHPAELAEYRAEYEKLPEFTTMIVPVGKGLHLAYRH